MKEIENPRVVAYIELVEETQETDVVTEFINLLQRCEDLEHADLDVLLQKAKSSSPKAKEREQLHQAMRDSVLEHCNS